MNTNENLSSAGLARLTGFKIPADRFRLLMPQFDWMMQEAAILDSIDLSGIEPANFYSPQSVLKREEGGHDAEK